MRRVRRIIRRTKLLPRTKDQNVEPREPLVPLIQIDYSRQPRVKLPPVNKPPVRLPAVNKPPFQLDSVNKPPVKFPVVNKPPFQSDSVNKPPVKLEQASLKPLTDYVTLAIEAAKALNKKTSLEQIDKVAKDLFKFDTEPHLHITMPDVIAQEIFNRIITLKERPMQEQDRLKLARKFIASLDSENTPVEKPDVL